MRRILITGARGQIGTDLSSALKQDDDLYVLCTDLKPAEHAPGDGLEAADVRLDVTDIDAIRDLVARYEIDTVFHLASLLSARGEENPELAWRVNVGGLRNVLQVAKESDLKVFWPSSIAVFGSGLEQGRADQDSPLVPKTMYGTAKVTGEVLCNYHYHRYGVDVRSLRYPGIISHSSLPGGGTTDYAVEIFHAAALTEQFTCYLGEDKGLPMMYMPDAIRATIELMKADSADLSVRTSYNIEGISFTPAQLADEIKKHIPGFVMEYELDFRDGIAASWPSSIDGSTAADDWSWNHQFGLSDIVADMLKQLDPEHHRMASEL